MSEKSKDRSGLKRIARWVGQSGAAIIAVSAVGLAVWEGLENRRHNRLSVVPKIDATREFDMLAQSFAFYFTSSGLGPAVVDNVCLYVDGEMIHDKSAEDQQYPWAKAYELFRGRGLDIWDATYRPGQFLLPGERYDMLRGELREGAERSKDFRDQANRINIVIHYCSVYGDQCSTEQLGVTFVDEKTCP